MKIHSREMGERKLIVGQTISFPIQQYAGHDDSIGSRFVHRPSYSHRAPGPGAQEHRYREKRQRFGNDTGLVLKQAGADGKDNESPAVRELSDGPGFARRIITRDATHTRQGTGRCLIGHRADQWSPPSGAIGK